MSFRVHRSAQSRHLVLRASAGDVLPGALVAKLTEEHVGCGWIRASGVLTDVELRAFDARVGGFGDTRRLGGPVHVLALDGSVGLTDGVPSVALRGVFAREGDRGLETLAGEIASARTIALEVLVTVLDDLSLERALDDSAGIWLLDPAGPDARAPAAGTWSAAVNASAQPDRDASAPFRATTTAASAAAHASGTSTSGAPMPQRPVRPRQPTEPPTLVPEAGDVVDHFAFGRCDVVRSEGDRLHLKLPRDGRIKEIALEMLRVTRLDTGNENGPRQFKLERRI
jgi:predicted DNA-binding protein with PD1-like motif